MAEAGILNEDEGDAVEIHREPRASGFERIERFPRGATLPPLAFPDIELAVGEMLG